MAQDPYGYQSDAGATPVNPSMAMWAGFFATMLAMVGPCTCYVTSAVAIPVGIWALWSGVKARDAATTNADQREMALVGMLSGLLSSLWSFLWVALIAAYILIYVGILFFVLAAGAAGGGDGGF